MYYEETQELIAGVPKNKSENDSVPMPYIVVPVSEGIAGQVFRSGQSKISEDPYQDAHFYQNIDDTFNFKKREIFCAPIVDNEGKTIGVVEVLNKKNGNFSVADLNLLEALAPSLFGIC